MEYRILGKTGLKISRMGFGGIPIQRIDAEGTKALMHKLLENGVNYIDTARGYTVSEEYLGIGLEGIREHFVLATKSMSRTAEAMAKDIDISLKNLRTDYIDLYQIHNAPPADVEKVCSPGGALEALTAGKNATEAPECKCIFELMDAVDSYIPDPERDTDKPFLMPVEDVFSITGRGTVATGRVERGVVKVSDTVEIVGLQDKPRSTVVTGVEMFRKLLDQAEAGDNIGVLLRGIQRNEVERGQVLAKPGSIHPHTHYMGQVYVLTKEEGGRHTPFFNGYRPQFYFRTTDVTGNIKLPEGVEMVMPGDNVDMECTLITPIAMDEKLRFAIREGGRTVGSGVVTKILE